MRTVGILGGMGPAATLDLMARVMAAVDALDDTHHVPLLVDQNPQVPSRIEHLIKGHGEDPEPHLVQMATRLETAGAEALAMACNTAHHYAQAVGDAVSVPVLNMVEIAAQHVPDGASVGLLASPAVAEIKLYDRYLTPRGITVRHPDPGAALRLVQHVKAHGADRAGYGLLTDLSASTGGDVQLIACTEFSLLAQDVVLRIPVIDALDTLVSEIVRVARS